MKPSIIFTGGGTAGHVTPNIALIEVLLSEGWQVAYVGSRDGIEHDLIAPLDIPFFSISTGKLRRYFSWQNFIDPFYILLGFFQSLMICLRHKPQVIFSKGGFVAVPIVIAAWVCRIPVITHESDITPGLANKICAPFARLICVNFPQTSAYLPAHKTRVTGSPMRSVLKTGDATQGRQLLGFHIDLPILMVVGGSLGAKLINQCIWDALPILLKHYQVLHLVGRGNVNHDVDAPGYVQRDYLDSEFGHAIACADYVISRAGANSLYELFALRKPHLLIPLGLEASRGDQIINAKIFAAEGMSMVLKEDALSPESLVTSLEALAANSAIPAALAGFEIKDSVGEITQLLREVALRTSKQY